MVKLRSEKTIQWAVRMLKQDYFTKDPEEIIDIWLFKDSKSYYKYAQEFFGAQPETPFGFYLEKEKALIMNIETGGGTLVHEIVHPFMRTNFPDYPPWFNEGLASLYEQCGEREGQIFGFTNWRLKGLQAAIRDGLVPSFGTLLAMDVDRFYNQDRGTNYGQVRKEDPTGYKTFKKILNVENMDNFKVRWEKFVLQRYRSTDDMKTQSSG